MERKGLVLLYEDDSVLVEWTQRLKRFARPEERGSGEQKWGRVKGAMASRNKGFSAFRAVLSDVCERLAAVDLEPGDGKRMLHWFREQHIGYQVGVKAKHRKRFMKFMTKSERFVAFMERDCSIAEVFGYCGMMLFDEGAGGKDLYVWVGVEPDLADNIDEKKGAILLQVVGWPSHMQQQNLRRFQSDSGLQFRSFDSADRGPALVVPITSMAHVNALAALCENLKGG